MSNIQPPATQSYSSESDDTSTDCYDSDPGNKGANLKRKVEEDEDDDIPLARSIPTALAAQRTIRREHRDATSPTRKQEHHSPLLSQPARNHTVIHKKQPFTESTKSYQPPTTTPVSVNDLTRRLQRLAANDTPDLSLTGIMGSPPSYTPHALDAKKSIVLKEATSTAQPRPKADQDALARSRSTRSPAAATSTANNAIKRANTTASPSSVATAAGKRVETNKLSRQIPPNKEMPADVAGSTTAQAPEHSRHRKESSGNHQGLTSPKVAMPRLLPSSTVQKVFCLNADKFVYADIQPHTQAADLLETLYPEYRYQEKEKTNGEWALWELVGQNGMERPVRPFERISDIVTSWNHEKCQYGLVIKRWQFWAFLRKEAIPAEAPSHKGYVEWESRRGKWNKRWMELRDSNVFLKKKEKATDEVFLCSMSNFDVYMISERYRSSKPYKFALKSTDNSSLFEDQADYLHNFCADAQIGRVWLQMFILARSYVLQQERTILFKPKAQEVASGRKVGQAPLITLPAQVANTGPNLPTGQAIFEPGSLLANRGT